MNEAPGPKPGMIRRFIGWEAFLGIKIISAAGALMILFGIFTFGRYVYVYGLMGPALQCAGIFAAGLVLLGAGEIFYRKRWSGFSLALTSCGSGTLFLGAALGTMTLHVLPAAAALGLCAAAALLSFGAALRYNAQLVAIFALTGGYLPVFVLDGTAVLLYGAAYFTVLCLFALLVFMKKDWHIARFIGLGAGAFAEFVLIAHLFSLLRAGIPAAAVGAAAGSVIGISFTAYLIIPLFGARKEKAHLFDLILLSGNLLLRFCTATLWIWTITKRYRAPGFIAAAFALCCIAAAVILERRKSGDESDNKTVRTLFFISGFAFSALAVLFMLKAVWFSAGWLIHAAGFTLYGLYRKSRFFTMLGAVTGACCLGMFLLVNIPLYRNPQFVWQYLIITAAAAIAAVMTLRIKVKWPRMELDTFRAIAAFNVWAYTVYLLSGPLAPALRRLLPGHSPPFSRQLYSVSFTHLICILSAFILAIALPRFKKAYNAGFRISSICLGGTGVLWVISVNTAANRLLEGGNAIGLSVFLLYLAANLVCVAWINDLLLYLNTLDRRFLPWYPLLISGLTAVLLAQNLIFQFSLEPQSLILTLLAGLAALGWVLFGFVKRNGILRISGLGMSFIAILKLFFLDLRGLGPGGRIISYFTAGALLLAISFAYHIFSKRLQAGPPGLDGGGPPVIE